MFVNTLTQTNPISDPRCRKTSTQGYDFDNNELFLQLTADSPLRPAPGPSDPESGHAELEPESAGACGVNATGSQVATLNPVASATFNLLPDAILVLSPGSRASAYVIYANTPALALFSSRSLVSVNVHTLFPTFPAPGSRDGKHMLRARTLSTPSRSVTVECTFGKSSREELLMGYRDRNCQGREEGKELVIMTMRRVDEPKVGERRSEMNRKGCGVNAGTRDRYRESRYYTEFEELEMIGRGGFGTVHKARNLLDEQIYAIKKVRLNCPPDELVPGPALSSSSFGSLSSSSIISSTSQNTIQSRILREVKTFARVSNHPNICRYYNAWVELDYDSLEQAEKDPSAHGEEEEDEADALLHPNLALFKAELDSGMSNASVDDVAFEHSSPTGSDETWEELDRSEWDDQDDGDAEHEVTVAEQSQEVEKKSLRSVLYIQMQWCPYSDLRKWLAKRADVEALESLMIFKQIVQAIVHVHSQGFTHQDIKPENVYIDERGKVYLGDFGLSSSVANDLEEQCACGCHEGGQEYDLDSESDEDTGYDSDGEHASVFFMDPARAEDEHEDEVSDHPNPISIRSRRDRSSRACCVCRTSRAAGVPATMTYSAPELIMTSLRSGSRGSRSAGLQAADIYSLGIVFLELFCVFGTRMERAVLVTELKKTGVIPRAMSEKYPVEASFLAHLLNPDPSCRPTAPRILHEQLPLLFANYRVLSMSPDDGDVLLTVSDESPLSVSSDSSATSPATSFGSPAALTKLHMSWTPRPHNGLRRWRSLSCSERSTASPFMNGSVMEAQRRRPMSYSVFACMPAGQPDNDNNECRDPYSDKRPMMQDQSHSLGKVNGYPHEPTTNVSSAGAVAGPSMSILDWFFPRRASHSGVATALHSPQQRSEGFLEPSKPIESLKHHASCHSMSSLDELSFKDEVIERLQQDLQMLRREMEMLKAGAK